MKHIKKHIKLYAIISILLIAVILSVVLIVCLSNQEPQEEESTTQAETEVIERIDLNKYATTLAVGETDKIDVSCTVDYTATFKSADEAIATVSTDGVITAVGEGETTIIVTVNDVEIKVAVTVTRSVAYIPAYIFRFDEENVSIFVGDTNKLNWSLVCGDQDVENPQITYSSSNENVAAVSADGTVTAKSYGEAEITATVNDIDGETLTDTVTVNVLTKRYIAFTSEDIVDNSMRLSKDGTYKTIDLKAVVYKISDENEIVVDTEYTALLTLASSDTSIVSVNGQTVSGVSAGEAEVTVEVAIIGLKETVKVTVYGYYAKIKTAADFAEISAHLDGYFVLANDVELGNITTYGVGVKSDTEFTGTFDGNGHKLTYTLFSGDNVAQGRDGDANGATYKALFGTIGAEGVVKNVHLNVTSKGYYAYTGDGGCNGADKRAGIAMNNKGLIENIYISYTFEYPGVANSQAGLGSNVVCGTNTGTINNLVAKVHYTGTEQLWRNGEGLGHTDTAAEYSKMNIINVNDGGTVSNLAFAAMVDHPETGRVWFSMSTAGFENVKPLNIHTTWSSGYTEDELVAGWNSFVSGGFNEGTLWKNDGTVVYFNGEAVLGTAK